jgi:hypothetical protein
VTFFVIVATVYFLSPERLRWIVLLLASAYFYATGGTIFLLQIIAATCATFWLAIKVQSAATSQQKKRLTTVGVLLLVANLVAFKYTAFLNETFRSVVGSLGLVYPIPVVEALLPLGISFYTFQLISYLIDVSRGTAPAERHLGLFALYVTFFPKIIAGPIERAKNLLPQLHTVHSFDAPRVVAGLQLMLWGAFKKVVVADRIAPIVSQVYDNPHAHDGVVTAIATWMYAFQIYCDFSGYTDMALGAALILGFRLAMNFDRPYMAISIQDFWKRWHISLTSWLTDYVYTPLTRQKLVKIKFYNLMLIGLFVTFVASGFWHGANWTFVAWGALHGFYIVASLQLRKPWNSFATRIGLLKRPKLHRALKIIFTFNLVSFSYILFRASSIDDAMFMAGNLLTGWGNAIATAKPFIGNSDNFAHFFLSGVGILIVLAAESFKARMDLGRTIAARPWMRWSVYYTATVALLLLGALYGTEQKFIYFRF